MAREVHDELGQVLTALRMNLSLVKMRFGALDADLVPQIESIKALADRALAGVRNVATHLRPSVLDLGLVPAIEWLCQEFVRNTGVDCTFLVPDLTLTLDEARAVVLWRIVQESLTNISRYAQATTVSVCLMQRGPDLWLQVRDDGSGFDVDVVSRKQSFGLLGMRERVLVLGGQLAIHSRPGKGTRIEVCIPQNAVDALDAP
jgi:signal transduction histidine kinase